MEIEHQVDSDSTLDLNEQSDANCIPIKKLSTEKLFGDANEILILHAGERYTLAITRQRKLILTKAKQYC